MQVNRELCSTRKHVTDSQSAVVGAVIGAAVAILGTVVLELVGKPLLTRFRAARVLLAEVKLNQRILQAIADHREREPERIADTIVLSMKGWEAVGSDINHLPAPVLESVLLRYAQFDEVNRLVQNYSRKADVMALTNDGVRQRIQFAELMKDNAEFGRAITTTLEKCELTIERLQAVVDNGPFGIFWA